MSDDLFPNTNPHFSQRSRLDAHFQFVPYQNGSTSSIANLETTSGVRITTFDSSTQRTRFSTPHFDENSWRTIVFGDQHDHYTESPLRPDRVDDSVGTMPRGTTRRCNARIVIASLQQGDRSFVGDRSGAAHALNRTFTAPSFPAVVPTSPAHGSEPSPHSTLQRFTVDTSPRGTTETFSTWTNQSPLI